MSTNFEDVVAFHEEFKNHGSSHPCLLTDDLFNFRMMFIHEETQEFYRAHQQGDLPKAADALVDLVYVAMGTAYLMGIPWQTIWSLVQETNLRKIRADEANPSLRGYNQFDIVKPDGWRSPDEAIVHILRTLGGRC